MTWQSLGTISSAARDWTRLATLIQGAETFRVSQQWTGSSPGSFWTQVRSFYPGFGIHGYRRIYPNQEDSLLVLRIPEELQQLGLSDRYLEVKLNTYARVFSPANWSLTLEVWDGPLLAPHPTPGGTIATPTSGPIAPVINTDPGLYGILTNDPGTYDP